MEQAALIDYIVRVFDGVNVVLGTIDIAVGDTFFIYDPRRDLEPARQFPFATIVIKDYGDFDNASNLDRPGVFRLNIGVSRDTFRTLFPVDPDATFDYTVLDRLVPHPVYATQSWVSVLNPRASTFCMLEPLLAEAYAIAVRRYATRAGR